MEHATDTGYQDSPELLVPVASISSTITIVTQVGAEQALKAMWNMTTLAQGPGCLQINFKRQAGASEGLSR